MNNYFDLAKPIWAKDKIDEINCTLFFKTKLSQGEYKIRIAANNVYRIFVNGEMKMYGPARAAHDYYRVDEFNISALKKNNIVVIEVYSSRCNNFYVLNTEPFLQCEILSGNEVIKYTGKDFAIYNNDFRYRKVVRLSYQRAFSESYKFDYKTLKSFFLTGKALGDKLAKKILKPKSLLDRNIEFPLFNSVTFKKLEYGYVITDTNIKPYEDRYMSCEPLIIFPKNEWEIDPNKTVSQLVHHKGEKKQVLSSNEFITFGNKVSLTGFINIQVNVIKPSKIYIYFDEIDTRNKGEELIGVKFYRNTTHNIITYELTPGKYNLITYEPYTARYVRVLVLEGETKISNLSVICYENPLKSQLFYQFANKKIQAVIDAAVNTFAHNAVDILTDCPSRERAGWLCDSFHTGQAEQLVTGKNLVEHNFLENYAMYKKSVSPENMVPACYPSDFGQPMFIVQWSMWYIIELEDYIVRTGDYSLVEKSKDNIHSLLKYYDKYSNEDGLIENLEGWRFVEWSKANDDEFVSGVNYPTNMLYYRTLKSVAHLLKDSTIDDKAEELKEKIIKASFNGEFFVDNSLRDEQGNLYLTDHITETCQYYSFFFGVADPNHFSKLFNTMKNKFGPNRDYEHVYPTVWKSNVLPGDILRLCILNKYGYSKIVFNESVDYFYKMAVQTGTLWEHDEPWCSLNHGFTSIIINIIFEANFGLHKIDNETKTIYINKNALYKEGKVIIPLMDGGKLTLIAKDNRLSIDCTSKYKIVQQ